MTRRVGVREHEIQEAAKLVLAGRLVAYPTDTVYGLGCNPFDAEAVERLVRAKKRSRGELPILVSSLAEAEKLGEVNTAATRLAEKYWPGPLTLVVKLRAKLPPKVTDGSTLVGLRVPRHKTALKLIEMCGGSIVGTSANVSGQPSPKTAEAVMIGLGGHVDLLLDGGPAAIGMESTVVRVVGDEVTVLREGAIPGGDILKIAKKTEPG